MGKVISVENLSKVYRLGQIGTGTFTNDLKVWWAKVRRKPNPLLKIGESDHGNRVGETMWALKDVSLTVEQGDVLGIIGRNGAGKSTLLKILSRITAPTSGRIRVQGRVASLLEVGTGFHPEMTGRENIYLNGAILGMSRYEIDRKFDEIVDFSEISQHIDTPIKRYSSGMYIRLAFAVAAHLEPEILVVDEVLAVGDASFQTKCLGKMGDIAKDGRTVLFVSHNMGAITSLTQKCLWIDQGAIAMIGEPQCVIDKYLNQLDGRDREEGYQDLTTIRRPAVLENRKASFTYAKLIDRWGNSTCKILQSDAMKVELGFCIHEPVKDLQFGVGVQTSKFGSDLFLVPSEPHNYLLPVGHYRVAIHLSPNYLRAGNYSLVLKMFANGKRQETMTNIMPFNIINKDEHLSDNAHEPRWVSGYFKFDFSWDPIVVLP